MKFEELNDLIPYAMGGKEKVLSMRPYPNIVLKMPGRHAKQTAPKGGDFVVCVNDLNFREDHQFKHNDIFDDIEIRRRSNLATVEDIIRDYYDIVVLGTEIHDWGGKLGLPAMDPQIFLQAVQCLAVAEHRRYAQHEAKLGGRYLPFRFAAGIAEGLWSAEEASWLERKGRPGVEQLEAERGIPLITQELFDAKLQ